MHEECSMEGNKFSELKRSRVKNQSELAIQGIYDHEASRAKVL